VLSRRSALSSGRFARRILEPVAIDLGVDYNGAHFTPPTTDAERAFAGLRCGEQFLHGFTNADEWPVDDFGGGITKRQARKAAAYLEKALERDEGRDALSMMTRGYGHEMATAWRLAAQQDEDRERAARLETSAAASEQLAELVGQHRPVRGYELALERVAKAERRRSYDPDNPDALIDLHSYGRRMRVIADALAVAFSARFDDFAEAILGPVYSYHVQHDILVLSDWNHVATFWSNLLASEPLSHSDVLDLVAAGAP
jgi:hypothetical protein